MTIATDPNHPEDGRDYSPDEIWPELIPAQKRAQKLKQRDPDFFKKIGKKGRRAVKHPYYHFRVLKKDHPEKLKEIQIKNRKGL